MATKTRKARKQYANTEAGRVEKSKDFASKRVSRVLSAIGSVSSLGRNKRAYVYTPDQVAKIQTVINAALAEMTDAFSAKASQKKEAFKL